MAVLLFRNAKLAGSQEATGATNELDALALGERLAVPPQTALSLVKLRITRPIAANPAQARLASHFGSLSPTFAGQGCEASLSLSEWPLSAEAGRGGPY